MEKKEKVVKERRKDVRLPIMHGILEPVELEFMAQDASGKIVPQPAILADLSAGGMRLITFMPPPRTKELHIMLQVGGMTKPVPVTGRIAWVKEKGGVYMSGIAFTSISADSRKQIASMADDFANCDTRIEFKLPEVCIADCKAAALCNKPQKDPALFKDKDKKDKTKKEK